MKLALIANLRIENPQILDNPIMHLVPNEMCAHIMFEDIKENINDPKVISLASKLKSI